MTKETALAAIRESKRVAEENANPRWHDIGGVNRAVCVIPTSTLQSILMLEPFQDVDKWAHVHGIAKRNAGIDAQCMVQYPHMTALEKALEGMTDG